MPNVCGESRAWNANYSTTISKYVMALNKYTAIYSDYRHSTCMTLRIHSTHGIYGSIQNSLLSFYYVYLRNNNELCTLNS